MMTKRDFNALAAALRGIERLSGHNVHVHNEAIFAAAYAIADVCAASNPRFNRARFLRAALGDDT